jgi:hypothetical protein
MLPVDIACAPPPLLPRPNPAWLRSALRVAAWGLAGVVIAGLIIPAPRVHGCPLSKADVAKLTISKYAYEAHPLWSREHPSRACPASLKELGPYMDKASTRDPWGRDYAFTCEDGRLFVMSLGEDGKANTGDDIWSNDNASLR